MGGATFDHITGVIVHTCDGLGSLAWAPFAINALFKPVAAACIAGRGSAGATRWILNAVRDVWGTGTCANAICTAAYLVPGTCIVVGESVAIVVYAITGLQLGPGRRAIC